MKMASKGVENELKDDDGFMQGLNTYNGKCTNANVAQALGIEYTNPKTII